MLQPSLSQQHLWTASQSASRIQVESKRILVEGAFTSQRQRLDQIDATDQQE